MLLAVRDVYLDTGKRIGIKPAGGIRQAKEALHYLAMVKEILGDDWLHPDLFRFGASALLVDVTLQIAKSIDGGYQNPDSFSLP
jgi:deoxyribose-phosphate aldolase